MSGANQCPSTVGKKDLDPASTINGNGERLWRSIDEFAANDSGEFQSFLQREFPAGASELLSSSRRTFLQLMGGAMALAGAATIPGCRRPDHKIMTYSRNVPADIVPGRPLYYATSMPIPGGGAEGLLVKSNEGRPTFVEGNPLHPVSQGKSSSWSNAALLSIYDPERLKYPVYREGQGDTGRTAVATWDDFRAWSADHFTEFDSTSGNGLVFIVDKKTSPTRDALRDRIRARWPLAQWVAYDATGADNKIAGLRMAFGQPRRELLSLENADVIFGFASDDLDRGAGMLRNARGFGAARRMRSTNDTMCRVYSVEASYTPLGGCADHRYTLAPSRIGAAVVELARMIVDRVGGGGALANAVNSFDTRGDISSDLREMLDAAADDLIEARGRAVVTAGQDLPPEIHALVAAMNRVLGAVGKTVSYVPAGAEEGRDGMGDLAEIVGPMGSGRVKTVVCVETNPCYDTPTELGFAEAYDRVSNRICLSIGPSETAAKSTWQLNAATFLESWGDTEAVDGTIAPIQPMIAPLYDGALSDIELLALIAEPRSADDYTNQPAGYDVVRDVWMSRFDWSDFEKTWRRVLHDGIVAGTSSQGDDGGATSSSLEANVAGVLANASIGVEPSSDALDVIVSTNNMYDGRFANLPWLQELPQFGTTVVWDNPALVSPATAEKLGLEPDPYTVKEPKAQMAKVEVAGRECEIPVWIMPGMADNTIVLYQGYGREVVGVIGAGVGFNVQSIRDVAGGRVYSGAKVSPAKGRYPISSTQNHWSMESRTSIVRSVDLPAYLRHGDEVEEKKGHYGTKAKLNFGEKLGELSHTPPNESIYENPLNKSRGDAAEGSAFSVGPQWGMNVDQGVCTGCATCTIACQAENNIPVVGKKEVRKGREMTWIRVDRYFTGSDMNQPGEMHHQPVMCQHCENAPCETVCPVNATVHGPEGLNYMVYNRCIGTRYCANNCPYKVRRFNFFDYATKKTKGSYRSEFPEGTPQPENINLIPPRLREKVEEIQKLRNNPDVTVRSRGVMEKCTYCIQRINAARYEMKLQDLDNIPDGFFQTACQAACPTGAIVFGDLLDDNSAVSEAADDGRSYGLLGYLNTRPRTTYKVSLSNPNPRLRTPVEDPFHHGHGDDHGSEGDHGEDSGHASFIDKFKKHEDKGYALSLKVLGAPAGVHA